MKHSDMDTSTNNLKILTGVMISYSSDLCYLDLSVDDDYGEEMLRIKDRQGREMLYGPTNEELITDVFRSSVKSYKSLPQILYHIQWKFRDEIRPRFGVMRCKEFFMKDEILDLTKYNGIGIIKNKLNHSDNIDLNELRIKYQEWVTIGEISKKEIDFMVY